MSILFHEQLYGHQLRFAVVAARCESGWLLCRAPDGGLRLPVADCRDEEDVFAAARRLLASELGVTHARIESVVALSFEEAPNRFGGLFFADIDQLPTRAAEGTRPFELLPLNQNPDRWPALLDRVRQWLAEGEYDLNLMRLYGFEV